MYLLDTRWKQMHNAMRVREGTVTITGSHPHSRWSLCAQGHSILSQYQASYPAILDIATYLSLNKLFGNTAWNVRIRGGGCDEYGRHTPSARAAPAGARLLDLPGDLRRRPARHRGPPQGWPARYRDIGGGGRGARPVPIPRPAHAGQRRDLRRGRGRTLGPHAAGGTAAERRPRLHPRLHPAGGRGVVLGALGLPAPQRPDRPARLRAGPRGGLLHLPGARPGGGRRLRRRDDEP